MRSIRFLLLALLFALSTSLSAAASVHACCPHQDCDIAHCVEMGCAPALPLFAFDKPAAPLQVAVREIHEDRAIPWLPDRYEDVWTPPD